MSLHFHRQGQAMRLKRCLQFFDLVLTPVAGAYQLWLTKWHFQHRFQDQTPALLLYYPIYSFAIDAQVLGVSMPPVMDASDRFANISSWFMLARRSVTPAPGDE